MIFRGLDKINNASAKLYSNFESDDIVTISFRSHKINRTSKIVHLKLKQPCRIYDWRF